MGECPCCGQTLPGDPLVVNLTKLEARVVRLVQRAGRHGISSDILIERTWADEPDGGPLFARETVQVIIHRANKKLAAIGKQIANLNGFRTAGRGRFAIYAIADYRTPEMAITQIAKRIKECAL